MNNLNFLTNLIDISNDQRLFNNSFKDEKIEELYWIHRKPQEILKIKLCFLIVLIGSIINVSITFAYMPKVSFILPKLIVPIVDVAIMVFQLYYVIPKQKYFLNFSNFIRFIWIYIMSFYFFINLSSISDIPQIKIMYWLMLYYIFYDLFMIYLIDFNVLMTIIILVVNVGLIIAINSILRITEINLNLFIPVVILYFLISSIFKRNTDIVLRQAFFETYKNSYIKEHFQKLLDDLNFELVTIKKGEILYYNKKFEEKIKGHSSIHKPEDAIEFKSNEMYFKQFNSLANKGEQANPKNLSNCVIDINESNNKFESLGQFEILNQQQNFYDIYFRSNIFNNEVVIDLIMYNLTLIKTIEKEAVESKFKHKILSKIAHEFKTPLITISTLINSLQAKRRSKLEYETKLKHIDNLNNYTLYLISDVIEYVSNNDENFNTSLELVDLKQIINFSYQILETLIDCNENKCNSITPILQFNDRIINFKIKSNEVRLKQILLNVISNAIKFTDSGEIVIKTKINSQSNSISILIKDTGRGISKENAPFILKDHVDLNIDHNYNKRGSGIGLSITKILCNKLGHDIKFRVRKSGGSRFEIIIPFEKPKTSIIHKSTDIISFEKEDDIGKELIFLESESDGETVIRNYEYKINDELLGSPGKRFQENLVLDTFEISFKTERLINQYHFSIVIVDDVKYVRENTTNLFHHILQVQKNLKYKILQASDGIELLNLLRNDQIHDNKIKAIFVDENMEYMNGSESIKIIRSLEALNKFRKYKIYSITAFEDPETRNEINKSKPDGVLIKPASKSNIKAIFKNELKIID